MIGISSRTQIVPKLYLSVFDRIKYFTEIFVLNFSFFLFPCFQKLISSLVVSAIALIFAQFFPSAVMIC